MVLIYPTIIFCLFPVFFTKPLHHTSYTNMENTEASVSGSSSPKKQQEVTNKTSPGQSSSELPKQDSDIGPPKSTPSSHITPHNRITADLISSPKRGPTLSTSTSSFEALDPHDPNLSHLASLMFSHTSGYLQVRHKYVYMFPPCFESVMLSYF